MVAATSDRKRLWQVGFYVLVEVEAYDGEASLMANIACGWPGNWSPPREPTEVEGTLGQITAEARVLRSQALMVREVTEE